MPKPNRIEILDSFRGIAAIVVVIHHVFVIFPDSVATVKSFSNVLYHIWDTISNYNKEAVLFFFLLSGFSIALSSFRIDWSVKESINLYLYKRFKRILPLFWFALAVTFFIGLLSGNLSHDSFSVNNLLGNIFLLQVSGYIPHAWFSPYGMNGPLWSISYEFFYYLLFIPWVLILYRYKFSGVSLRLSVICSILISFTAIAIQKFFFLPWIYFANSFAVWMIGVYLFYLFNANKKDHFLFGFLILVLVSVEIFDLNNESFSLSGFSSTLSQLKNGFWISVVFYIGLAFSQNMDSIKESTILTLFNKIWKPIGDGSYTIYLIHYPILLFWKSINFDSIFLVLPVLILILAFSVWVERWVVRQKFVWLKRQYL